ncbi:Pepco domain-containing protein [Dapis sp. BLCC M172]|uniref:Pepco domain-containing protein n=1 Tax=Dapis sp. BLCC M172 TaxID=2975281 RepID=UPI003CF061DA
MSKSTILIVTNDTTASETDGQRGWVSGVQQRLAKAVEIPVSVLEDNMTSFLEAAGRLFQQADRQIGTQSDLQLDEVELQVEISGKGEVKLVAGGEATGKGTITLKFKRPS